MMNFREKLEKSSSESGKLFGKLKTLSCGVLQSNLPPGRKRGEGADGDTVIFQVGRVSVLNSSILNSDEAKIEASILKSCKEGDLHGLENLIKGLPSNAVSVLFNCKDIVGRGSTPLHVAAGFNRIEIAKYLLNKQVEINARDNSGMTALHNAASYGHDNMVKFLLKNGANVNATDHWKFSPLHEAAYKHRYRICRILLDHDADSTLVTCNGMSAVDLLSPQEQHYEYLKDLQGVL